MRAEAVDPRRGAQPPGGVDALDHELLLVRRGTRTGVYTIVAVHSTVLGPALGGCRVWHYATLHDAVDDALRLSRAMTLKAAAAGLSLGGGKAVIWLPDGLEPDPAFRREMLHDFADAVDLVDGRYITAEDVGTNEEDMAVLSTFTPHVVGRPTDKGGSGDPGDFTAAGVEAAIRACCRRVYGSAELSGRTVSIVGLGSVGDGLARRLQRAGAVLAVSDIEPDRARVAHELDAAWLDPGEALRADVDVLAPCALGGVLDDELVEELRCRIVCGAANNQLAHDSLAERLAARGILYAPDFIVNAGGLINVGMELNGYDRVAALRGATDIEAVLGRVLAHAEDAGLTPLAAGIELAQLSLASAAAARPSGR
jgi:leucine dehydrogenase